jgi:hypothetical protein
MCPILFVASNYTKTRNTYNVDPVKHMLIVYADKITQLIKEATLLYRKRVQNLDARLIMARGCRGCKTRTHA